MAKKKPMTKKQIDYFESQIKELIEDTLLSQGQDYLEFTLERAEERGECLFDEERVKDIMKNVVLDCGISITTIAEETRQKLELLLEEQGVINMKKV